MERETRRSLRAEVASYTADMHKHEPLCAKCKSAGTDVYAKCEVWWNAARKLHVARRLLYAFEHASNPDQMPLPGMEDQ